MVESRITRRSFGALGLGVVAMSAGARFVMAQDATPAASPVVQQTIFSGLGEKVIAIDIEATELGFSISNPGCLAEGWYLINLTNASKTKVAANIGMVPEGQSVGDLSSVAAKSFKGEGGELPEWWTEAKFAGGVAAEAGATGSSLVYLMPGSWAVFNTYPMAQQSPATLKVQDVEGLTTTRCIDPEAAASPAASPAATPVGGTTGPEGMPFGMTVDITDTAFVPTASPIPGDLVMEVKNSGDQPHDMIVLKSNSVLDLGAATSLAQSFVKGEEVDATIAGGVGGLSTGMTAYTEIIVEPATYVAFSSFPDVDGGLQIDKGLVTVFSAQ